MLFLFILKDIFNFEDHSKSCFNHFQQYVFSQWFLCMYLNYSKSYIILCTFILSSTRQVIFESNKFIDCIIYSGNLFANERHLKILAIDCPNIQTSIFWAIDLVYLALRISLKGKYICSLFYIFVSFEQWYCRAENGWK